MKHFFTYCAFTACALQATGALAQTNSQPTGWLNVGATQPATNAQAGDALVQGSLVVGAATVPAASGGNPTGTGDATIGRTLTVQGWTYFKNRLVLQQPGGLEWAIEHTPGGQLALYAGGNWQNPTLRLNSNGRVEIGSLTSAVGTVKLAVEGSIGARGGIYVRAPSVAWPDYVFRPAYALQPLPEVEHYIQRQGHLPGVPSAADVAQNGVELVALNAVLLRKIEELTLHLIALQRESEALKARLEQVAGQVAGESCR